MFAFDLDQVTENRIFLEQPFCGNYPTLLILIQTLKFLTRLPTRQP